MNEPHFSCASVFDTKENLSILSSGKYCLTFKNYFYFDKQISRCTLTMTVSIVVNLFLFVRCVAFVLQQQQQRSSN